MEVYYFQLVIFLIGNPISQANETYATEANGTVLRRQAAVKYNDILYSKPPNRYYAFQMATYEQELEGSTKPTTTPQIFTFNNSCDYDAYYCLRVYTTGVVCARTLFYAYHSFPNICLMEYANCYYRATDWHIAYMGHCFQIPVHDYPYNEYSYLKRIRVQDDPNSLPIDLY